MSKEVSKYILPFTVPSSNRREPFTEEAEKAATFCLADLERVKSGGLIVKHPSEKIVFIAKVCYPLWIIGMNEISLLFDGLNTTSHKIVYQKIPDVEVFIKNLNESSKTRHAYATFLTDNINYFQITNNQEEKVIEGLITNKNFLNDFFEYANEASPIKSPLPNTVIISPTLDENHITSVTEDLKNLRLKLKEEVKTLYESMKLINSKTEGFLRKIRSEIREIEKSFDKQIEKCKASIAKETEKIRRKYDEEVTEFSKEIEEELLDLQQEKIKLEKTREQLTSEIEHCEAEIKTSAVNKDEVAERKWKEEKEKLRRQTAETDTKIKELEEKIKSVEEEKKLKIFKLKSERDTKIREASKDLVELEASRDAKTKMYRDEMEKLEELTSTIIQQIDKLAKLREAFLTEFDKLGVKQRKRKIALIYMPFYLACYKTEAGKRYSSFPPSIVNSISFSVKVKGALRKPKIKQLLQPRSKEITSLLNKFPLLLEENAVFNREIDEACLKANMLGTKESIRSLKIGLDKLKDEGWLSDKERETFIKSLAENQ